MARRRLLIASVAAAVVVGGGLAAGLALTSGGSEPAPAAVQGASRVNAMLRGIPQQGERLGSAKAPVTLVEFADPQCPYCAAWARTALPTVVSRYVRTGKVQIVFNGMTFVGPESLTAMRPALAAGQQARFWNVMELLFENQGTENAGWVTESLLHSIGDAVPGLDTQRMLDARNSAAVERGLARAGALATQAGVNSTPTFAVGKTGGSLSLVRISTLEPSGITPALDAALKQ